MASRYSFALYYAALLIPFFEEDSSDPDHPKLVGGYKYAEHYCTAKSFTQLMHEWSGATDVILSALHRARHYYTFVNIASGLKSTFTGLVGSHVYRARNVTPWAHMNPADQPPTAAGSGIGGGDGGNTKTFNPAALAAADAVIAALQNEADSGPASYLNSRREYAQELESTMEGMFSAAPSANVVTVETKNGGESDGAGGSGDFITSMKVPLPSFWADDLQKDWHDQYHR